MSSNEIVKRSALDGASLPDMVRYADHLANANLLPAQYRLKPANVLYAMEYGRTLGITPLAAITGIHVIEGKPSASAALISGLVRQAGHKLRVRMENGRAVATITRCDDPDFEFRAEWDMDRARTAGLANKDVWKKYPQAMLKARAISEVARDACEEVLFGLHYTPEEIGANVDGEGVPVDAEVQQLRRVQPGPDQWSTPTPQTVAEGRDYLHEANEAADAAAVRQLWQEAKADGAVPEYLAQIAQVGKEKAAAEQPAAEPAPADDVVDAEVVDPVDDYAAAVAELREAAEAARLDDFENGAQQALGCPIADASTDAIRALAAQIRPAA